jgi:two-component system, cell cycle sensor histidine kinase and response regulator CckA
MSNDSKTSGLGLASTADLAPQHNPSADYLRELLQSVRDMILCIKPDGTIHYASPSCFEVLGYLPAQLIGQNAKSACHRDDLPQFAAAMPQYLDEANRSISHEARFRHQAGHFVLIEFTVRARFDAQGQLLDFVTSNRNIANQRKLQSELIFANDRLSKVLAISRAAFFEWDLTTSSVEASQNYMSLYGRGGEPAFAHFWQWLEVIHPDDREHVVQRQSQAREGSIALPEPLRFRVLWPNGEVKWLESHANYSFDADGKLLRVFGMVRDVDAEVATNQKLATQAALMRTLMENIPAFVFRLNAQGIIQFVTDNVAKAGFKAGDLIGKHVRELGLRSGKLVEVENLITQCIEHGFGGSIGAKLVDDPDAQQFQISFVPEPVAADGQKHVIVTIRDVTDLARALQRAREATHKQQRIMDTMNEGLILTDTKDRITFTNRKFDELFGYAHRELVGKSFELLLTEEGLLGNSERLHERRLGRGANYHALMRHKNNSHVHVMINSTTLLDDTGEFAGVLATYSDQTQVDAVENELLATKTWLEFATASTGIGVFEIDLLTGQMRASALMRRLFRLPGEGQPVAAIQWSNALHGEDAQRIETAIADLAKIGGSFNLECRILDEDGKIRWCNLAAQADGHKTGEIKKVVGSVTDITGKKSLESERARLQQSVLDSQRHESMALMAGGVAHDLNNLLTVAMGQLEILKLAQPGEVVDADSAQMLGSALGHMAALAKQMLIYSGRGKGTPDRFELHAAIEQFLPVLRASVSKRVNIHWQAAATELWLLGDATQLSQVFLNLVINAAEAMGETGGDIRITARRAESIALPLASEFAQKNPNVVVLEIADNGPGMPAAIAARVFEPFFSQKGAGRGLGLAVVYGMVRAHGGEISVLSEPGQGTVFQIVLPSHQRPNLTDPAMRSVPMLPFERTKSVAVLLVEDEENVALTIADALRGAGFLPQVCNGVKQAQSALASKNSFVAIVCDLMLRDGDGAELFLWARQNNIRLPILLTSGYAPDGVFERLPTDESIHFLAKPFLAGEMVTALNECIKLSLV